MDRGRIEVAVDRFVRSCVVERLQQSAFFKPFQADDMGLAFDNRVITLLTGSDNRVITVHVGFC